MKTFKDLTVWQRGMQLVTEVYALCRRLPAEERFGLISQLQRASISIPSNIAEGYKRKSLGDYVRFLNQADGSAAEVETQLILAHELYNIECNRALQLNEEVQKMLFVLIKRLRASQPITVA